ncbi:hypothetical protein [Bhargavaea beijingensis]|uniref:Uncharacterized protein n=1 Tax=Bhargavaea beijingensis TaxID=426756 RepID=A0A1G7FEJ2_9BACL|nr:hypothetical protein [Bhargavaea beijingensis]MCW1929421.1 hypothetical protein [Bhargavaea beijingensis]SDE74331.1 hypothetical protein SAMN04488126_11834 [Bhargavaea beijingensis]
MFVNEMLTVWLYGSVITYIIVGFALWKWYFKENHSVGKKEKGRV